MPRATTTGRVESNAQTSKDMRGEAEKEKGQCGPDSDPDTPRQEAGGRITAFSTRRRRLEMSS